MSFCEIVQIQTRFIDIKQVFIGSNRTIKMTNNIKLLEKARRKMLNFVPQIMSVNSNHLILRFPISCPKNSTVQLLHITPEDYEVLCTDIYRVGQILNTICGFTNDIFSSVCMVLKIDHVISNLLVVDLSEAAVKHSSVSYHSCSYKLCLKYGKFKGDSEARIACIVHIGSVDIYTKFLLKYIKNLSQCYRNVDIFYTMYDAKFADHIVEIPGSSNHVQVVENRGMDIGPFLTVLSQWKKQSVSFDFVFKLHTKSNDFWRKKMCHCLLGTHLNVKKVCWILQHVPKVGLIGSANYLLKMDSLNTRKQMSYCDRFGWDSTIIHRAKFVGGTIFCMNFSCIEKIMEIPIDLTAIVSEFDTGYISNRIETNTHAWERILGIVVFENGQDYIGL
tara:strand:+ start:2315 stop:3484 length:1170 start_codon:yes stop_codon:yes gene_type:complete